MNFPDVSDFWTKKEQKVKKSAEEKRILEEEEKERRREKALKSMSYLLKKSQLYAAFFRKKIMDATREFNEIPEKNILESSIKQKEESDLRPNSKPLEKKGSVCVTKCLKYLEGGILRPYQVEGVTWMTVLFENGMNGILADEMGLGKTIQVIALICHLYERHIKGPFLIIAPLSTLTNWKSEFEKFAPQIPVVVLHGSPEERASILKQISQRHLLENKKVFPVVLTSYAIPMIEKGTLRDINWEYVIVDEGHRLKNHQSKLSLELRTLRTSNRLLLTGTPLQNNLTELWALLNFLLPFIFSDMNSFTSLLLLEDMDNEDKLLKEEESSNIISTLHKVLTPFMLRRTKNDVLMDMVPKKEVLINCPLSQLQKDLYSYILEKNITQLCGHVDNKGDADDEQANVDNIESCQVTKRRRRTLQRRESRHSSSSAKRKLSLQKNDFISRITMQSPMVMLKKVVDHPYLIHFPLDPKSEERRLLVNEELITSSGKMMVLDAMLPKLKDRGHKVLIFSTLVMLLDLVEEYMILRGYSYRRLDGSHSLESRTKNIKEFNQDPDILAFLLSTRAGGLGLNLTGADTVIFFDRDWNPQADIQAQDRCHRIGQTKPVVVYTLSTENTIDERIINLGHKKRRLEKVVIKDGKFKMVNDQVDDKSNLSELQQLLKDCDKLQKIRSSGSVFTNKELDKILDRSDLHEQLRKEAK